MLGFVFSITVRRNDHEILLSSVAPQSPPVNNQSDRITKVGGGVGISPFVHTHNYISLTVGKFDRASSANDSSVFKG